MNRRILVLGGNGFIGGHLVEALIEKGMRVRVFDRPASLNTKPIQNVDYRFGDFSDSASVAEALVDIDIAIHLISTTVPTTANMDPIGDVNNNLIATIKLLQLMRDVGVSRLVFLSSGGTVYGNAKYLPVPEDHERNPLSSYGIVKSAIEDYITMFGLLYGLKALVLRASNPYGPRQGHLGVQGVIPTFFQRVMRGDPIQIWGDGSTVRDFLYISDLISFIVQSIQCGLSTGVFNVGSGIGTSLLDVVSLVSEISKTPVEVEHFTARGFDVKNVVLDISKAIKVLNWTPTVSIRTGCERYWNWAIANEAF